MIRRTKNVNIHDKTLPYISGGVPSTCAFWVLGTRPTKIWDHVTRLSIHDLTPLTTESLDPVLQTGHRRVRDSDS